jgi:cytochrome c
MATIWLAAALLTPVAPVMAQAPALPQGDAARGEQLYQSRCGACHSLDTDRVGPHHRGIFGRQVASVAGFRYSGALKKRSFVWDAAMLDKWLENPTTLVPGTAMGVRVSDARDRADIIAYLGSRCFSP